jgi:hypothetical protein
MSRNATPERYADAMDMEIAAPARGGLYRLIFGTIRNKIILPFLILTLLVTALGTFVVTRLVAASIQDRLTTQLLETSRAAGDRIVAWERVQIDMLRLVVFTIGTPEAVSAGQPAMSISWGRRPTEIRWRDGPGRNIFASSPHERRLPTGQIDGRPRRLPVRSVCADGPDRYGRR